MNPLLMEILKPVVITILGGMTTWLLNAVRKWFQAKTGIAITDDQFTQAVKEIKSIEERVASGQLNAKGSQKTTEAVANLMVSRPSMTNQQATAVVQQAVGVDPDIGMTATNKICAKVVSDDPKYKVYTP